MTYFLTLVAVRSATSLSAGLLDAVRDAVAGDAPIILSDREAVDIPLDAVPDPAVIRAVIGTEPVDCIVTAASSRRKRLLIADMDSTIITTETLDELAGFAGLGKQIAAITARAMNGEIDFKEALRDRVGMLRGLALTALERTWEQTRLTDGALELVATMRAGGAYTALVSGGFTFFTSRVAALTGFDTHRSNVLHDDGVALTGTVAEPILDRSAKLDLLRSLSADHGLSAEQTLAVGDGANDLDMLRAAGLGVAFHAKPIVAAAAGARVDHANLRALLFAQGYAAADFVTP